MPLNPVKVIQVKGQIENKSQSAAAINQKKEIVIFLHQDYANFTQGIWEMCIKDVIIIAPEILTQPLCFQVSTNFVYGQYTQTTDRCPIPLERFLVKKENPIDNVVFSPSTWFVVNSTSNDFRVFLEPSADYVNSLPAQAKVQFSFTFLFRRIK